jgi:hypothetical protein
MPFIRYKTIGKNQYAYKITTHWNPQTKKPKQTQQYLGKLIDKEKQIYQKNNPKEKQTLDFGDTYLLEKFYQQTGLTNLLQQTLGPTANTTINLIYYKLCHNAAMTHTQKWIEGNYLSTKTKPNNLTSQKISHHIQTIADENLQKNFFKTYIPQFTNQKQGIIIDATSLPNQIHNPLTAWGRSGEEIDQQIRFLLVLDKDQHLPLFFRALPGNIIDVSTLQNTLYELKHYGVKKAFLFLDAGFFSEENIKKMCENELDFIIRMPAGCSLYKELVEKYGRELERRGNIVVYGERGLFVFEVEVDLFGQVAFAYLVLDPVRRGRELTCLMRKCVGGELLDDVVDFGIVNKGVMVVVSSFRVPREEVVLLYYVRQVAEVCFGFSKDDLGLLPLRVYSLEAIIGLLFLQFLTLVAFVQLRRALGKKYTVEEVLLCMRNLKCKVFDKDVLINELTKEQKEITQTLNIIVPKTLGI